MERTKETAPTELGLKNTGMSLSRLQQLRDVNFSIGAEIHKRIGSSHNVESLLISMAEMAYLFVVAVYPKDVIIEDIIQEILKEAEGKGPAGGENLIVGSWNHEEFQKRISERTPAEIADEFLIERFI